MLISVIGFFCLSSILTAVSESFVLTSLCLAAHLQKLMSDKKCTAERKAEMEEVITQVSVNTDKMFFLELCKSLFLIFLSSYILFRWTTTPSRSWPISLWNTTSSLPPQETTSHLQSPSTWCSRRPLDQAGICQGKMKHMMVNNWTLTLSHLCHWVISFDLNLQLSEAWNSSGNLPQLQASAGVQPGKTALRCRSDRKLLQERDLSSLWTHSRQVRDPLSTFYYDKHSVSVRTCRDINALHVLTESSPWLRSSTLWTRLRRSTLNSPM